MLVQPAGRTIPSCIHHLAQVNGTRLHYVVAGETGSPVILVHGFPESWWAFHRLIPLLARRHRVIAVDLRGFGDSGVAGADDTSATLAEDLHALIVQLRLGPVHLLAQDVSGSVAFRLACSHPDDLLSLTAVEMGLAGFGLEALADVSRGGAWYIGPLATRRAADAFFSGRAASLIGDFIMPAATVVRNAVTLDDIKEFARGYERSGGWSGATVLYSSILSEGAELRELAAATPLALPALAIDRASSEFTFQTIQAICAGNVDQAEIEGAGHYIAIEASAPLAAAVLPFLERIEAQAEST